MSTHASISIKRSDGSYSSIYLHHDGYVSHAGKMLLEHYNTTEKAEALITLGDLSCLYESIECPEGHSFVSPIKGYTVAYTRDRGGFSPAYHYDADEVVDFMLDANDEHNYLWDGTQWLYRSHVGVGNRLNISSFEPLTII